MCTESLSNLLKVSHKHQTWDLNLDPTFKSSRFIMSIKNSSLIWLILDCIKYFPNPFLIHLLSFFFNIYYYPLALQPSLIVTSNTNTHPCSLGSYNENVHLYVPHLLWSYPLFKMWLNFTTSRDSAQLLNLSERRSPCSNCLCQQKDTLLTLYK